MVFFHVGNTQKSQGFFGVSQAPAAGVGGKPRQDAGSERPAMRLGRPETRAYGVNPGVTDENSRARCRPST